MGDVYWMTAILLIQAAVSAAICTYLTIKSECVAEEEEKHK